MQTKTDAYLGLDFGGTGVKAGVFSPEGRLLGFGHQTYSPAKSAAGHAEIPMPLIAEAARETVRRAVTSARARVVAMAISSQGQTFTSLDEHDQPLHPAIIWYDSRARVEAEELNAALRRAAPAGGTPAQFPELSAPKIMWLRRHYPEVMARARRFLLLPDYFAYRLTGRAVTDPCTGASTGLGSPAAGYCPAVFTASGIAPEQVAAIQPTGTPIATVLPEVAADWELSPETLLVTGTNDQYAGALGAGNCRQGILSVTTGTCLAPVLLLDHPAPVVPGLMSGPFAVPGLHYLLAYSKTAGLLLDWFVREFGAGQSFRDLEDLAGPIPPGANGLIVLPYFDGIFSPTPDAAARGVICDLTLQHGRADFYRAVLESLAFSLRDMLALMARYSYWPETIRAIGGGAKSDLLMQINADVLGKPVERPAVSEAAVLGAAMLAAVGHGAFPSVAECSAALYRRERVFTPDPGRLAQYEPAFQRYVAAFERHYGVQAGVHR